MNTENPKLGILYFCLSGSVFCINFMLTKILYENHPELVVTQLLVYRSVIIMLILALYLNKELKSIMIDTVDEESVPPLITRVITGSFVMFVNYMAVRFF